MKIKKRGKMISAARVRSLLSSQESKADPELQKRISGEIRLLEDGQLVLVHEDGKGTLYPSRDAFIELMDLVEGLARQGPVDPKRSLLPPPEEFLASIREHAEQLAHLMGSREPLDGSEVSLGTVDRAVRSLPSKQRMSPEWMSSLVAYTGEIMRAATHGRWAQMNLSPGEVEPVVVTQDGRVLQPFALVYGELRRGRRGSLQGAVNGVLRAIRLGGMGP
jgi:hypothetical protein